jgi:hypothetical protein
MRDFGWVCCHSGSFPEAGLNWCQKTESCNCVAPVTLDGPSRFGRGHEDSSESPSASREVLPERMNQARRWAYHDGFHEESHGIGPTPIMCRTPAASVKAARRIPAFPHNGQHVDLSATLCG